jgi:hypothetical protein
MSYIATFRDTISQVIKDARLLYSDLYVPNKYIYLKLIEIAKDVIKKDSDNRRVFDQRHIFSTIKLFKLEGNTDNLYGVSNFISVKEYRISSEKLPEAYTTYTGLAIIVNTIEPSNKQFVEIKIEQYENILKREFRDRNVVYWWFQDGYLVFPEVSFRAVRIDGLFINIRDVQKLNGELTKCEKFLDQAFSIPEYLEKTIREMCTQDIIKYYLQIKPDAVPDQNENNKDRVLAVQQGG